MAILELSTATSSDHWRYLSEGGATIVFSYSGPDERFHDVVLRISKGGHLGSRTTEDEELDTSILFQSEIISRLVPHEYLVDIAMVSLRRSWLEALSVLSASSRPSSRADSINTSQTRALLVPNLVSSPISVEIKPKWSFLKSYAQTYTCRFCMHACCRGWTSAYCPLDLFSSSPGRVKKALYALYDSWTEVANPATPTPHEAQNQNNLRLFVGGSMILSGERNLLVALEEHGLISQSSVLNREDLRNLIVETLHLSLIQPKSSTLLEILNQLQRSLDGLGIEGLASSWNEIHSISDHSEYSLSFYPSFGEGCSQPTINDWCSFIAEYQNVVLSSSQDGSSATPHPHTEIRSKPDVRENLQYHILSYLLSATFKDCSIMIMLPGLLSIDQVNEVKQNICVSSSPSSSPSFDPSQIVLKLIDLDPKPISRLQKWLEQDRAIIRRYLELLNLKETEKKECVDDWDHESLSNMK